MKTLLNITLQSCKLIGHTDDITSKKILQKIQELYSLKHNGKKIKELYECQKKVRTREHNSTEYVHMPIPERGPQETKPESNPQKFEKEKKRSKHKNNNLQFTMFKFLNVYQLLTKIGKYCMWEAFT